MKLLIFGLLGILILVVFLFLNQKPIHISKVIINKPFNFVWEQFSKPENYSILYPNWVKTIKKVNESHYLVHDQFGGSYNIEIVLNREFGVVDLIIGQEVSRSRLMPLDENTTAMVHLAKKWDGIGLLGWFFHKRTTDKDLENAKKQIEIKKQ
ncbi:MAG: hypothetical protein R3B45_10705 [Bdellovibrionota bacterium]